MPSIPMSLHRYTLRISVALAFLGCSVVRPEPVLEGEYVKRRSFGRVGRIEVLAATQGGRNQVDVVCHDDPGSNLYHPSAYRLSRIISQLDEMLAMEPPPPGSAHRVGEVTLPVFGEQGTPKMTFGTATPNEPGATPSYEVDCYDAFVEETQHFNFTRSETESLRELFVRARGWLKPE